MRGTGSGFERLAGYCAIGSGVGFARRMRRTARFPQRLGVLGLVTGIALIVVYLGRLVILTPTNPVVLAAAGLTGFILAPAWYLWLGITLLNDTSRRS